MLNILNYPNVCFDVIECGDNVLELLPYVKDGHILWKDCICAYDGDEDSDIIYKGKHYVDFCKFMQDVFDEES